MDSNVSNDCQKAIHVPTPKELRLQKNLQPIFYNLTLKIYVPGYVSLPVGKDFTFDGDLEIHFMVKQSANKIVLNSLNLDLPTNFGDYFLSIKDNSLQKTKVTKIVVDESLQKVIFELDNELEIGKEYNFQFRYSGNIRRQLAGLYLTTYRGSDGQDYYAAVTQMAPADARKMVPCFDEPEFKAIWKIKIHHPKGTKAVSNAIEILENQQDPDVENFVFTTFEETPKMSSYLLAIIVSNFEFVEGKTGKNVRFRIWARKDAIDETKLALEAGIKILEFYENYFGIPFPLKKQDMFAIPDFVFGAMENWGLVTYKELALLYNKNVYTEKQKRYVIKVVAHELAHQWFGNLVTMKWWDDVWLNEAFATLMEKLGTDFYDPSIKIDDRFIMNDMDMAFKRDSMANSHPLIFPIEKIEDLIEVFDSITYQRGASFLRMLKTILGHENFQKGLHKYLTKYSYMNAEHKDLWTSFTDFEDEKFDVNEFAKKWTEQMGYPVIFVETTDFGVKLTQKRFKMDENAKENVKFMNPEHEYKWNVPIWFTINGKQQQMKWLDSELKIPLKNKNDLIFINSESNGFYRVKYDVEQMKKINEKFLKDFKMIKMRSRARYIDDVFVMAKSGLILYEEALEISKYLVEENELIPFVLITDSLNCIKNYFEDEPESEYIKVYLKNLYEKRYDFAQKYVFGQNDVEKKLNSVERELNDLIVIKMSNLKHKDCIEKMMKEYLQNFVKPCKMVKNGMSSQCSKVAVGVRTAIYCVGIEYGKDDDWNFMFELFKRETVQVESDRLLAALTSSRDTFILKKMLKLALDINNKTIRFQDKAKTLQFISNSFIGQMIVYDYFMNNWEQIYQNFKGQQQILKGIIEAAIRGKTVKRLKEVENFLEANKATTDGLDVFKKQLENIQTNVKWVKENFQKLANWFKNENEKNF